jgi:hypothetical protein
MNGAFEEFLGMLSTDAAAIVYYSGHGVYIDGTNYLIPTDLRAGKDADVANGGIDMGRLLDRMSQVQTKFALAVVDACHSNPFQQYDRSIGAKKPKNVWLRRFPHPGVSWWSMRPGPTNRHWTASATTTPTGCSCGNF